MARISSSESSRASVTRLAPRLCARADAVGAGDAHLRAAVDLELGRDLLRQFEDAEVLHDDGVGPGFGDSRQRAGGLLQLMLEDQRVEGDVAFDAAAVEGPHDLGQFVEVESDFGAGGEMLQAEVDGVGAGLDGGVELRPVSGRTHDFGFTTGEHRRGLTPW